ncbi:MAG: hypothetical protein M3380_02330, partial [Chloroflexota bacterium]|nr:hypothetical protein [Chloroflexota bacterium]
MWAVKSCAVHVGPSEASVTSPGCPINVDDRRAGVMPLVFTCAARHVPGQQRFGRCFALQRLDAGQLIRADARHLHGMHAGRIAIHGTDGCDVLGESDRVRRGR